MSYTILELSDEQKATVLAHYTTLDLTVLTRLVFKNDAVDGRSTEAKSIKAFLAGEGKTIRVVDSPATPLQLTDDQRVKIDQLASEIVAGNINQVELTQIVFNDPALKIQSKPWRAVHTYLKEFYPAGINVSEEPVESKQYEPPNTIIKLAGVVNEYVTTGDHSVKAYDWGRLKVSEKRQLSALMSYIRVYSFKYTASQYEKMVDRELFLSTFVRWTHNKPDLTEIEVDQMIMAAAETVNIAQIARTIQRIDKIHEEILAAGGEVDDGNGKKRKFGMTDVELINAVRTKYDAAKGKLEKLMSALEESRSKRVQERDRRSATFIDLVNQWTSDEEFRAKMVALGKKEKQEDVDEVQRLGDLGDLEALISGQTREEGGIG